MVSYIFISTGGKDTSQSPYNDVCELISVDNMLSSINHFVQRQLSGSNDSIGNSDDVGNSDDDNDDYDDDVIGSAVICDGNVSDENNDHRYIYFAVSTQIHLSHFFVESHQSLSNIYHHQFLYLYHTFLTIS